jgi:hypothetical protein
MLIALLAAFFLGGGTSGVMNHAPLITGDVQTIVNDSRNIKVET